MILHGSSPLKSSEKSSLVRKLFYEIVTFFAATYQREFKMPSPPLHDPVAVAAALAPEIFDDRDGERFSVHVVRGGNETVTDKRRVGSETGQSGRTVVRMLDKGVPGVRIPRSLDVPQFWHLIDIALGAAEDCKAMQSSH
jgi:uridine nucleosidase